MLQITMIRIEEAIRANCIIDTYAEKKLTLVKYAGTKNKGIGRILFMYFAVEAGYGKEDICDYLEMSEDELYGKASRIDHLFAEGKEKFEQVRHPGTSYNFANADDSALFFYRKIRLIENYLRYR